MKHVRGCPLFTHPTQREPGHPTDCRCPGPTPGTQTARLVRFLRSNPGASSLEITLACQIVNTTGRISDARASGVQIECFRRGDGIRGYRLIEAPVQLQAFG